MQNSKYTPRGSGMLDINLQKAVPSTPGRAMLGHVATSNDISKQSNTKAYITLHEAVPSTPVKTVLGHHA
jgi:hypothetical protein